MNKTIESLQISINDSKRLKEKLLNNLESENRRTIILNLVELEFDFSNQEVEIMYYAIDDEYPNTKLNFLKFREILEI